MSAVALISTYAWGSIEKILDGRAHGAGEGEELGRRQGLTSKEDHQMVEPGTADLGQLLGTKRLGEIGAVDLGPERAGDGPHLDRSVWHRGRGSLSGDAP
jgi:hypothetical protein